MKEISMEKRVFTEEEAAIYICMSRSFLRQDRMNSIRKNRTPGPKYTKKGRLIRYLKEHLDEWLETNFSYNADTLPSDPPFNSDNNETEDKIENSPVGTLDAEAIHEKTTEKT